MPHQCSSTLVNNNGDKTTVLTSVITICDRDAVSLNLIQSEIVGFKLECKLKYSLFQ